MMIAALSAASSAIMPAAAPRTEATPPAEPAPSRQAPPAISPRLRIDGALNLVVMEFRAPDGKVLHSLPTQRELAAYRDEPREDQLGLSLDRAG